MSEPKPMKEIHEIRHKMYEETKHMSDKEYIAYIQKNAKECEEQIKKIKPAKDLKTFFANLKKRQAS